jgi:hypothetical protein
LNEPGYPRTARLFQEALRATDIRSQKRPGILNRPIHVGFSREVHDGIGTMLLKDSGDIS